VQLLPGDSFDGFLEIKEAFSRIAEPIAGEEIGFQREVGIAPVRQPPLWLRICRGVIEDTRWSAGT